MTPSRTPSRACSIWIATTIFSSAGKNRCDVSDFLFLDETTGEPVKPRF